MLSGIEVGQRQRAVYPLAFGTCFQVCQRSLGPVVHAGTTTGKAGEWELVRQAKPSRVLEFGWSENLG